MIIYPAIDLLDGKCVRLQKGDFKKSTTYYEDPLDAARFWKKSGSDYLHIVDLNGSKDGFFYHLDLVKSIIEETGLSIQFGGGIRSKEQVDQLIQIGVDRLVIGSLAVKNVDLFQRILEDYGDKIVCAIDAKNGYVATDGWTSASQLSYIDFAKALELMGCTQVLYTDIERDGMLTGPDLKGYEHLKKETPLNIVASGGIATLEDVNQLKSLDVYATIIGKAFYEKRFSLEQVLTLIQ